MRFSGKIERRLGGIPMGSWTARAEALRASLHTGRSWHKCARQESPPNCAMLLGALCLKRIEGSSHWLLRALTNWFRGHSPIRRPFSAIGRRHNQKFPDTGTRLAREHPNCING